MTTIAIIAAALAALLLFQILVQILRGAVLGLPALFETTLCIVVLIWALDHLGIGP